MGYFTTKKCRAANRSSSRISTAPVESRVKSQDDFFRSNYLSSGPGRVKLGEGETTLVEPLGASAHVHVQIGESDFVVETRADQAPALDSKVEVFADEKSLLYFDKDGQRVEKAPK
jgi:ABC-type sugar transport system ATPase subunit